MNSYLILGFWQSLIELKDMFLWPILAGLVIGILAPLIGSVIVIRRLSFIADTLSHFSLAGITFGALLAEVLSETIFSDISPVYMAIIFSVAGTFIIEKLRGFYKNYKELSMPIVMSLGTALTGIFIALSNGTTSNMTNSLLFGSFFDVTQKDFFIILIMAVCIIIFAAIYYKKIIALCFDETFARVSGIKIKALQLAVTVILAIFISITMQIFGVLLISALMVVPVAASILVGKSFKNTIVIAAVFSELSITLGVYLSFIFSVPTGSLIVILNVMIINKILQIQKKDKTISQENINPILKENIILETDTSITVTTIDVENKDINEEKKVS